MAGGRLRQPYGSVSILDMTHYRWLIMAGCLAAACMHPASADPPDAGDSELLLNYAAIFTGTVDTGDGGYYNTDNSRTVYNFSAGLGVGLGASFEAGLNLGYGRLNARACSIGVCNTNSVQGSQWSLFLRHNFSGQYATDGSYAFSGIEFSMVYPGSQYSHVTLVRPYLGYRFNLPQNWALELSVGGSQVVSGTSAVASGYEVHLGLAIPLW